MSLRNVLFLFALALIAAGASLLYQSTQMPEWTDQAKFDQVQTWDPPMEESGPAVDAYNRRWVHAINRLRTDKWPYHDAGAALITFALCLVAALLLLRVDTMSDVAALKTPKRRWAIYALGIIGWFLYWASAVLALVEGFDRFEFPPWSNSQITMVVVIACFAAIGSVVLAAISFFILRKSELPAPLWVWRKDMPGHDWFYTLGTAVALVIGAEVLRETYCYGHWLAIPSVFLCVYATLAMRAAGIAKTA
jgi:hypothetical protein